MTTAPLDVIVPPDSRAATGADYLRAQHGIRSWLLTRDHKRIGIMFLLGTTLSLALGGLFALLLRLELLTPERTLMSAGMYNRMFTLHGIVMVFMFMIPSIPAVFGNFLLPIMIGAKDVAFPRLNLASFYVYMAGSAISLYAMVAGGADSGWTFYTPYSTSSPSAITPVAFGVFVLGLSSIMTGLNFIVSVHTLRARSLGWRRLPLFVWSIYATSIIQVLATPVLGMSLLLVAADRVFQMGVFDPRLGGDPLLFQHLFWFYSHPAVYIMILPAMGVISEVVCTFSHNRPASYRAIAYSSLGIAFVGFLTWGHHMFVAGMSLLDAGAFGILSMLTAIFSAIKVVTWTATLRRGQITFETPMLYFFWFLFLFVFGGMTGVAVATSSLDVHWHDTYFVVAHFHFIMVGGTLTAYLAALHYWFPKMFGRMYSERWGMVASITVFTGFLFTFTPQFLLGNAGMPRRYYSYPAQFQWLHVLSTAGASILTFGLLLTLVYLGVALVRGPAAPQDPWKSRSYEWDTASPPPPHNFVEAPRFEHGPYDYHVPDRTEQGDGLMRALEPGAAHDSAGHDPGAHFETREQREHAAHFGMWLFLTSETLLFGALIAVYIGYRLWYGPEFAEAARHNDARLGTLNTLILVSSSFFAAWAVHAAERARPKTTLRCLAGTVLLGLAFVGVKSVEYADHFAHGIFPGHHYESPELPGAGARLFFTLYYLLTGLHAVHVIGGLVTLSILAYLRTGRRAATARVLPLELGVLYWHLVDVVWIFLWPMLYLAG